MAEEAPPIVERRKVIIEYTITPPNVPAQQQASADAIVAEVMARLARQGSRRVPL